MCQPRAVSFSGIKIVFIVAAVAAVGRTETFDSSRQAVPSIDSVKLPIAFEPNTGRESGSVAFKVRTRAYTGLLTRSGSLQLAVSSTRDGAARMGPFAMDLQNSNRNPQIGTEAPLATRINYFIGKDSGGWKRDIPTYESVLFRGVYPGVNLRYYGSSHQVEYDFQLQPGVDPQQITIRFRGASRVFVDAQERLHVLFGDRTILQERPIAYQTTRQGVQEEIACRFVRKSFRGVGFELGEFDHSLPLTIDPTIVYSSFVDGNLGDDIYKIALDGQGNLCFVGRTRSTNLGTVNALQTLPREMFVGKLNAAGTAFLYLTYLGTGAQDQPYGIAADANGSCYLLGATATPNFPTTTGSFQSTFQGGADYFVAKLSPSGNALVYATYLGGSDFEAQTEVLSGGIAVDAAGNAYVSGSTPSTDFPVTAGAFQTAAKGFDAFVTKINATGTALIYSTRLGGSGDDFATAIAIDSTGNAFVTGYTGSHDFPVSVGALQIEGKQHPTQIGWVDAFVAKVNASGSALLYATFLGGSNNDAGWSIQTDTRGNAYVGGTTSSQDFPVTPGAYKTSLAGTGSNCTYFGDVPCTDFFVSKINSTGTALAYSTLLGGSADEGGGLPWGSNDGAIAVDVKGAVYVVSSTKSRDLPTSSAIQSGPQEGSDAFVCKLAPTGATVEYCTYLGGTGEDFANGAATDSSGNLFISGSTSSAKFPNASGLALNSLGSSAGFILKISDLVIPLEISSSNILPDATLGRPYSQALVPVGGTPPYSGWAKIYGAPPAGLSLDASGVLSGTPTSIGISIFTIEVHDTRGAASEKAFTLTVAGAPSTAPFAIVNAASYGGGTVAPGEIVTVFGAGFGPAELTKLKFDFPGHVSTLLAGTQVMFDGVAASVIYAEAGQASVVVPYEVAGKAATNVQIVFQGVKSATLRIPVAAALPGIFTIDASGQGQSAAVNQDGTINSLDNPVSIGSIVSLYLTGEGQTTPEGEDGKLATVRAPFPTLPVVVMIGGVPAQVQYAGGAPGEVAGVLQVNAIVPAGVLPGGGVPVAVKIGDASTQSGVTIAVKAQ